MNYAIKYGDFEFFCPKVITLQEYLQKDKIEGDYGKGYHTFISKDYINIYINNY